MSQKREGRQQADSKHGHIIGLVGAVEDVMASGWAAMGAVFYQEIIAKVVLLRSSTETIKDATRLC